MRILLISPYFPPQDAVASRRVHGFASTWSHAGHDVTVLTTAKRPDQCGLNLPCDGIDVVALRYRVPALLEWIRAKHKRNGVGENNVSNSNHSQTRTPVPPTPGVLSRLKEHAGVLSSVRMPDLTDYWVRPATQWALRQRPWDVIVSSSGPYTAHLVAMNLRRASCATCWVADFRDLWTSNHAHRGVFPFTLRERILESHVLREANLIACSTDGLATSLTNRCGRDVTVIYNGFDAATAGELRPARIFPDDDVVRIVYTGTLYTRGQDPTPLLRAMRQLKARNPDWSPHLKLIIAGAGSTEWNRLAQSADIDEMIEVRGTVDRIDALRMQRDADALLLLDWHNPRDGVLTAKVFEYLHAQAPILVVGGAASSPIGSLVHSARRGVHLGTNVHAITGRLGDLLENPTRLSQTPNHQLIASLNRHNQSMRLLEVIRGVIAFRQESA